MNVDKLVYEIREELSAISDDRRIDKRYILHVVDTFRADLLRKMLARKPYYNTVGMEQSLALEVKPVSRSLFPGVAVNCYILKTKESIPTLVYEGSNSNWFEIKTADIGRNTIENIDKSRVSVLSFEFNSVFGFLDRGTVSSGDTELNDSMYAYIISKDNFDLEQVILSGIFESPSEVHPNLTDYPIKLSDWATIRPGVLAYLRSEPMEDPINNSEPDDQRQTQAKPESREANS